MKKIVSAEVITNHLRNSGFVFAGSEIYGGLANTWDYGPVGTLVKNNLKNLWIRNFVTTTPKAFLLDTPIIMNRKVWQFSTHEANFSDFMADCKNCKRRFRADNLDQEVGQNSPNDILSVKKIKCPNCSKCDWTPIRQFNLMLATSLSANTEAGEKVYLRPETAQGIFINYANIVRSMRAKLPFSVAQIGKAFRNEITPGNFMFRTREFEQMEIEHFCDASAANEIFENYLTKINDFLISTGINKVSFKQKEIAKQDLAHYSSRTVDFEYHFPHGWGELWGLANRASFDLDVHEEGSKQKLVIDLDTATPKNKPFIIEPSVGVDRLFYAIMCDVYNEEQVGEGDIRIVMKLPYQLCAFKVAILPLSNKLEQEAYALYLEVLQLGVSTSFDTTGTIGKRYRRQDAIGTFFCVTVDFETNKDQMVTIRNRDTMKQDRIKIDEIQTYLSKYERGKN